MVRYYVRHLGLYNATEKHKQEIIKWINYYKIPFPLEFLNDEEIHLWKEGTWFYCITHSDSVKASNFNNEEPNIFFEFCEAEYWEIELNPILKNGNKYYECKYLTEYYKKGLGDINKAAYFLNNEELTLTNKRILVRDLLNTKDNEFYEQSIAIEFINGKWLYIEGGDFSISCD